MPKIIHEQGIAAIDLAKELKLEILGSKTCTAKTVEAIEDAKPYCLTFFKGKSELLLESLTQSLNNVVIIIPEKLKNSPLPKDSAYILSNDPFKSFLNLIPKFFESDVSEYQIHPTSVIHPSAIIKQGAQVGPFCSIAKDVVIGENCIIHSNVTIYPRVNVGKNSIIHSGASIREDVIISEECIIQNGAVIGGDGFGYIPDSQKGLISVPQIGNVVLEKNVDVGANTCIDRATLGSTKIGSGSKVDNLVQIGHNTQVGSFSIICGQAAIAGSSKIGNQVILGGNVGVADHTEIADGARFAAFSGLHGHYEKGDYAGNPALPASTYRRVVASLTKLPDLIKKVRGM